MAVRPTILLIEDSPGECELFRLALAEAEPSVALRTVSDGDGAFHFLEASNGQESFPSLVLLDLQLSGRHGSAFLKRVRADMRFGHLPVVVFTTLDNSADIALCYANGANSYLVKPATFVELVKVADILCRYWLNFNQVAQRC